LPDAKPAGCPSRSKEEKPNARPTPIRALDETPSLDANREKNQKNPFKRAFAKSGIALSDTSAANSPLPEVM